MKHLFQCLLLLVIMSVLSSCTKHEIITYYKKQKKVQEVVNMVRQNLSDTLNFAVPSLSVLIQTPTDKIFASSLSASGQVVTPFSYFRFASNTKNFTATAILNMYENGWLDYKAKIIDNIPGTSVPYVPDTPDWDFPYKNEITIEQLLQHAAGVYDIDNDSVPGYDGMSYVDYIKKTDPTHQFSTSEMIKVVKDNKLFYFPPGTGYHYSNTGYSILAEIIKRAYTCKVYGTKVHAVKTYQDYLEDSITGKAAPNPLKVHFPVLATDNSLPNPHIISTALLPEGMVQYDDYNVSAHVGEGNGYGTMEDLNKHIRALIKGRDVLQPATVELMMKDVSTANKGYALGCTFTPNLGYGHNGAIAGYLSLMVYDPDYDVSVIVMMPFWDLREDNTSFLKCFLAIYDAGYGARAALGFPGKP